MVSATADTQTEPQEQVRAEQGREIRPAHTIGAESEEPVGDEA